MSRLSETYFCGRPHPWMGAITDAATARAISRSSDKYGTTRAFNMINLGIVSSPLAMLWIAFG